MERKPAPFRFSVSVSGVKFPFSEHWRTMQRARDDVTVSVIGKGELAAPLASLPILMEASDRDSRHALYNLAEVAKISDALAQVYVEDKNSDHYRQYQSLIAGMRPLGMTYESLLAYAKLLEG